jgi:hypothetical protein
MQQLTALGSSMNHYPSPLKRLFERLNLLGTDFSQFAVELEEPAAEMSEIFLPEPLRGHLHVIADVQLAGKVCILPHSKPVLCFLASKI